MHPNTFLTMCLNCNTVLESPRIQLHSAVTCASCNWRFTAEENFYDIEETFVSNQTNAEDKEVYFKEKEEGMNTNATGRVKFDDFAESTSFGIEEHYKGRVDWTLVSSTGLEEGTETIGADKDASNDNIRLLSCETRKHGRKKPAVTKFKVAASDVAMKEVGFRQEESKTAPGKSKKRKLSQTLTWGIALRKPSRVKKRVKSYSPSRESGSRKRGKLGLHKGTKMRRCDHTAAQDYRKKGGEVEKQSSGRNQRDFFDADAIIGKATTEETANKRFKLDHEAYFEQFKKFLTAEIKRQLGGLGEESNRPVGDVQVVDVEEVLPHTPNSVLGNQDAVTEGKQFIAKVKVMATIFIPISLHASEHSPPGFSEGSKSREVKENEPKGKDESKGGELKEDGSKSKAESKGGEVTQYKPKGREGKHKLEGRVKEEVKAYGPEAREGKDEPKGRVKEEVKEDEPEGRECKDEPMGRVKEEELEEREGKDEPNGKEVKEEPKVRDCIEEKSQDMALEPKESADFDRSSGDEPWFMNGNEEVEVPESEYYDFDFNRSEDKFAPGQIWASYDSDKDVMPRDYVQIKKVVSIQPFEVQIALLQPAGGSPISCGEFRIDKRVRLMKQIDAFSHLMRWEKGQDGMICIFPAEKEVWALYKRWREIDPQRRIRAGYDIVEVVAVKGDLIVTVIPLLNHKGSKTVFQKADMEPFEIHKKDFVRFSHQIATYELLGCDGVENCMELDPAAIPFHGS